MKKQLVAIGLAVGLSVAGAAFAHGSKTDTVAKATTKVIRTFSTEEADEVVDQFAGVKSWLEGEEVRVKVYLSASEFLYACAWNHHGAHELKCEKKANP